MGNAELTRRNFIAQTGALGLAATTMTGVARAQTPKRGGHLIVGLDQAGSADSLDPAFYVGQYLQVTGTMFYDWLVNLDDQGRVKPWLAESWEAKPGAKEWVFKIRKGVTFHNGKELVAEDVVYSLNHHRGPDSKSAARSLFTDVSDIKATDKYEVTIFLANPNIDLVSLFPQHYLGIGPQGSSFTDGVGTGAFTLDRFDPGVRTTAKRNTNDWNSQRGYVDTVEVIAVNDPLARMNALLSGAVHIVNKVDVNILDKIKNNPAVQVFNTASGGHHTLCMHCDTSPYDNADFRLALKFGTDRETILKLAERNNAVLGNDQPVPSFDPVYAELPQRPYDPDKAKFYFKKSGYDGPITFSIAAATFPNAVPLAEVFQASLKKAGIEIRLDRVPNDNYYQSVWNKQPFFGGNWSGRPTADLILRLAYATGAFFNETHWSRPKFDQLLSAARAEADVAKRKQMYADMQLMIHEDGGAIIPVFYNFIDGASSRVKGYIPNPVFQLSGFRAPEKVWLED